VPLAETFCGIVYHTYCISLYVPHIKPVSPPVGFLQRPPCRLWYNGVAHASFDGHIAQYLGDGLLIYFGYPQAYEDDAQRAVRARLWLLEALEQLNARLTQERGMQVAVPLGIHTGLVVGGGTRQEQLALGATPNLAARLQGLVAPNTLVGSRAHRHIAHVP